MTQMKPEMSIDLKLNLRNGWLGYWPRQGWQAIFDPENARIHTFLSEQIEKLTKKSKVLDAGAGHKPYKGLFKKHLYESCDMPGGFYSDAHNFECYLDNIPSQNETYNLVVLTQVLEHVPNPLEVLVEIHRILKPKGCLLISVPLNAPLHGEPYHYYHFTHYGLHQLAIKSGFNLKEIEKVGGIFWALGKRLPDAFSKLFKQYDPFRAHKRGQNPFFCVLANIALFPLYLFGYLPCAYLVRPLFYWLDRLDLQKSFTLGYTAVLEKENELLNLEG